MSQSPITLPNTLDAIGFAASRAREIECLKQALACGAHGVRRVFQTLPRHMRRRAASYNLKRLPIRLRSRATAEFEKDPITNPKPKAKPPCRRRRRRADYFSQKLGNRSVSGKIWLETHLFYAKRAHMVNMWGFRLAKALNEKSLRASLNAARNKCIIYDMSYFGILVFNQGFPALVMSLISQNDKLRGLQEPGVFLVTFKTPTDEILGPGLVVKCDTKIKFIAHPLIITSLQNILTELSIAYSSLDKYCLFRLEGPISSKLISKVLQISYDNDLGVFSLEDCGLNIALEVKQQQFAESSSTKPPCNSNQITVINPPWDSNSRIIELPNSLGFKIWTNFLKKGAKFVALDEISYIDHQLNRPIFPDDWAHSLLFDEQQFSPNVPSHSKELATLENTMTSPLFGSKIPLDAFRLFLLKCICRGVPKKHGQILCRETSIGTITTGLYSQIWGVGIGIGAIAAASDITIGSIVQIRNSNGSEFDAVIVEDLSSSRY